MTDFGFSLSLLIIYCKILFIQGIPSINYVQGCGTPQDDCRDQVFVQSIQDKALIGHVIDNITAATPQLCRTQCYIEPRCVSINFDQNPANSANCQLSSSEAVTHPRDLVDRPGMIYQGTKNNCQKDTCPPLMECHSGYTPQGYRCTYPDKCCKVPDERVLYFPRKSVHDYIKLTTSFNTSLTHFTLSLMVQIESSDPQHASAPFSLATTTATNHLLIYITPGKMYLYVLNQDRNVNIALNDGKWHHICTTWESTSGKWQVYIDGHILGEGTGLAAGKVIGNGIAIIGQDQDSLGGEFEQRQSFGKGRITSMSLWDRVLSPHDGSLSFLANFECHPQPGKVLSWEDMLTGERHGDVKLL